TLCFNRRGEVGTVRRDMNVIRLISLMVMGGALNCSNQAPRPQKNDNSSLGRDALWERRRQCSSAIGDVLKHTGWAKPEALGFTLFGASSHYNQLSDRCYVRIDVMNRNGNPKIGIPSSNYM